MPKNILVPLDLSKKNRAAIEMAASLGAAEGAETTLFHVIQTIDGLSQDELRAFYEKLEAKAHHAMHELAGPLRARRIAVRERIVYGEPVKEIVEHAQTNGTDLIVLSSHAIEREHPFHDWGTVSYKVAILCTCPVLLVK